ncbi:hypothetical protein Daus18300_001322 [Diaporthe australafricana]|uniref:Uncharacterized protein n=1 Tax=Diaporthe australafricana TaxID=127596 RepID=A0ABR3XYN7_9PEZI
MAGRRDENAMTKEQQMAEAIQFQREVNRATDRRSSGAPSRGSNHSRYAPGNDRTATGTPHASARQDAPQRLATPEQFFGSVTPTPISGFGNTSSPVTQHLVPKGVSNTEPMHVDVRPSVRPETTPSNVTKQANGHGLVSSRWGTFDDASTTSHNKIVGGSDIMDVDKDSLKPKPTQAEPPATERGLKASAWNQPSLLSNSGAKASQFPGGVTHEAVARDNDSPGVKVNSGKVFGAATNKLQDVATSTVSKGLLDSKWASSEFPSFSSFSSSSTPIYPDPSTLEPVYVSADWLSDLSAENKAMNLKKMNAAKVQPTQTRPVVKLPDAQTPTAAKGLTAQHQNGIQPRQHSGQTAVNSSAAAAQASPTVQTSRYGVTSGAPSQGQAFGQRPIPSSDGMKGGSSDFRRTVVSSPSELSRAPASAQPADEQPPAAWGNTSARSIDEFDFKDWYDNQFMKRKK